ncbi:MAG: alpha/beta hydrolase [Rubrivivax sp.]|nr:alpha/beta hydrolase [Rubrivivax sp.]
MTHAPVIVFSHANGFPAGTYRQLFEAWREAGFEVRAPEKFGHDPAYPVTSNWPHLRDQLVHFIEAQAGGQPVHLVGHSLGGYLSVLAASKRPALARSVVLIDAPLVAGWRAHSVHAMKLGGLMKRLGPGRVSVRRRWQWPSAEAAWNHFAAKHAFARWEPGALRDYIACGTEPDPDAAEPGGVRLAFYREIETRIYNTLPHHMGDLLGRHPLRCPVAFIGGTRSVENRQAGLALTRALAHERVDWVEGSHLFPMERPLETARAVLRQLGRL